MPDPAPTHRERSLTRVRDVIATGLKSFERRLSPEIQNIISTTGVTSTWDKTAAVKYIVWNNNQWVSYDDADTFKQVGSVT